MGILTAFQKRQEVPMAAPARAALDAHLERINALVSKRNVLAEKARIATVEVDAANKAATESARLQAELDTAEADARYSGTTPDLKDLQTQLAKARLKAEGLAPLARAAQNAHRRFAFDMGEIGRQQQELHKAVPALLHAAVYESIADFAAEFEAAEAAFRAAHRKAFTAALAADKVSLLHQFGLLAGSDRYADLNITRPYHPAYLIRIDPNTPGLTDAERLAASQALAAEHTSFAQDLKALEKDAETFVNTLLIGQDAG